MRTLLDNVSSKIVTDSALKLTVVDTKKKLITSFAIMMLAFFFSPPPLEKLTYNYGINDRWKAFSEQINGTYNSHSYSVESHESKLSFRIIPAVIGKLSFSKDVQTQMIFLYIVQVIFGFLAILVMLNGIYKITQDWLYAKIVISGLMLMHLGSSFFYDTSFFLDGFPFFFLILALFTPSTLLSVLLVFIGFWCDERVLLGGIGVVLFRNYRELTDINLRNFIFSKNVLLYVLSVGSYLGIRLWLTYHYMITIPLGNSAGVGFKAIWEQRNHLAIAQMLTFEFYWLYVLPVLVFFYKKSKILAALIFMYLAVSVGLTGIVLDIMRSINYLFPIIILGIIIYYGEESKKRTNETALFVTAMNLLIPNYRYFYYFFVVIPLPLKLVQLYFGSAE